MFLEDSDNFMRGVCDMLRYLLSGIFSLGLPISYTDCCAWLRICLPDSGESLLFLVDLGATGGRIDSVSEDGI